MIKVKIKDKTYEVTIPQDWNQISYSTYLDMIEAKDADELFLCSLGLPMELKGNSKLIDLYSYAEQLDSSVYNVDPDFKRTDQSRLIRLASAYFLPEDITTKSIAQYEDCKVLLKGCYDKEGNLIEKEFNKVLGKVFSIYLQTEIDGEYNYDKACELEKEIVNDLPCEQVISNATFFLNKLFKPKKNIFNRCLKFLKMKKENVLDITI